MESSKVKRHLYGGLEQTVRQANHCCAFSMQQANIGQDEDFEAALKKAESLGAKKVRNV